MQDAYTGDIGDFAKYGLLGLSKRLGVAWSSTRHQSQNGQHLEYLEDPNTWRGPRDCRRWRD